MSCFPPQETRQNSAASIATSSCYSALSRKRCRESPLPAPAHYRRNVWATRYSGTSRRGGCSGRLHSQPRPPRRWDGGVACLGLLPPLNQTRCRVYPPDSVKFTWTCVSTATGSPFSMYGLYRHCFTASIAPGGHNGGPPLNPKYPTT